MPTFGAEFVDAGALLLRARDMSPDVRMQQGIFTSLLQEALNRLQPHTAPSASGQPGGFVYFPPGDYVLTGGMEVPSKVTVIFAPGAIIHPARVPEDINPVVGPATFEVARVRLHVRIRGSLQAGAHQIFGPAYSAPGVFDMRRGPVVFEGDRVTEVLPEWWGAAALGESKAGSDTDSWVGIQSALDAAFHDRFYGSAIPVVLRGRYRVSRPIVVGRRPWWPEYNHATPAAGRPPGTAPSWENDETLKARLTQELRAFVLRGSSATTPGQGAIIEAGPSFAAHDGQAALEDRALLMVRGPRGYLLEDITLDGRCATLAAAPYLCLRLETRHAGSGDDSQMNRVRRCVFKDSLGALVSFGEYAHPIDEGLTPAIAPAEGEPPPTTGRGALHGSDLLGNRFEQCEFHQTAWSDDPASAYSGALEANRYVHDGFYFRAGNALMVELIDCSFRGYMRAAIRLYNGRLTVMNCAFDVQPVALPADVAADQDGRYYWTRVDLSRLSVGGVGTGARDNGCCIYIEWTPQLLPGLLVRGATSKSWRFLSTFSVSSVAAVSPILPALGNPNYDVLLQDVTHQSTTSARVPAPVVAPPAIEWNGPHTDERHRGLASVLCLDQVALGPVLVASEGVATAPWSGQVAFISRPNAGPVVDLGSTDAAGELPLWKYLGDRAPERLTPDNAPWLRSVRFLPGARP